MEWLPALVFGSFGAILASFAGVVAERIHTGQSWVSGRSRCGSCARVLGPADLVPIASWLAAGGRCSCGSRIPWDLLAAEVVLFGLFVASYLTLGFGVPLVVFVIALWILLFTVLYDLRHTIVPRTASTALVMLGVVFAWLTTPSLSMFGLALLVAGAIGLAFVFLHGLSGGRAMGLGDAPIAFALSLLAAPNAVTGLVFSFWIGALYGILVLVGRRGGPTMGIEVPFVPFLAVGFLLAYFSGWNLFPLTW